MKRKKFEGIDKKIIDLLKVHGTLSTIELANYLGVSRSFVSTTCRLLVKQEKLKIEIVKTGNHPKYVPATMIFAINKDYKPKSYAVSMDDYIKKDNEYLTKESALLLFKQLIEVIEDQAGRIQQIEVNQGTIETNVNYYINEARWYIAEAKKRVKESIKEKEHHNYFLTPLNEIENSITTIEKLFNF